MFILKTIYINYYLILHYQYRLDIKLLNSKYLAAEGV